MIKNDSKAKTRILIIEDEEPAYKNLKRFVEESSGNYEIVDWIKSIDECVLWFSTNTAPDLVFLDIQLSDGSAFEIFNRIKIHTPIIFSTAYDEFAINAFKLNSVDYLLKPTSFDSVNKALIKYNRYHINGRQDNQSLTPLLNSIQTVFEQYASSFLVKRGTELIKLPVKNIAYIYADESTFCVADNSRIYSLNKSLINVMDLLEPKYFFKLNRKVICNSRAIINVKRGFGNKLVITLTHQPDFNIVVSRERANEFKIWYENS
ncbi:MAG: response regulator transcription factor [Kangiellaceae bacterium]|nr:response regulator transcription factor [Kangiellaceae bacterium]